MSTFEDIICSQCNTKIDQALMLSCEHNLCMNCAAKNLSQQNLLNNSIRNHLIINNILNVNYVVVKQR